MSQICNTERVAWPIANPAADRCQTAVLHGAERHVLLPHLCDTTSYCHTVVARRVLHPTTPGEGCAAGETAFTSLRAGTARWPRTTPWHGACGSNSTSRMLILGVCAWVSVSVPVFVFVSVSVSASICMRVCVYVCVYVRVYLCVRA